MSAPTTILFTFRPIPTLVTMCEGRDIDVVGLLRQHGIPEEAATGQVTAPLAKLQAFLDDIALRLHAPLLGLDLADRIPRGSYGLIEFVVRAAPSVRHGLSALCELSPLLNPLNDLRYIADERGCEVHFAYGGLRDALGPQLNEYTIAFIAKAFASVLGTSLPLERAWFAHSRPDHAAEVAARLACNVGFQGADSGFAVTSDVIEHRIASADPQLFEFLLTQARTQLENVGGVNVVAMTVRAIEARLNGGRCQCGRDRGIDGDDRTQPAASPCGREHHVS
ncbi:MAG: AraC family transcriptional regulator [Myxococcales bacterium]|nr:AraC family transcriptional regulator [Myxococcales bacterium]